MTKKETELSFVKIVSISDKFYIPSAPTQLRLATGNDDLVAEVPID